MGIHAEVFPMTETTFFSTRGITLSVDDDPADPWVYQRLLKKGGVRRSDRDAEYADAHFPRDGRGRYDATFEVYHRVSRPDLEGVMTMVMHDPAMDHVCGSWVELLTLLARRGPIKGLTRIVAAGQLWRRPGTEMSLVYAPALCFFKSGKVYLALHRLDERWLPGYGLLVKEVGA